MQTQNLIQSFESLRSGAGDSAPLAYAIPAMVLVGGLVLWLSGAKVLKGLFVLAGCGTGALVGVTQAGVWIPAGVFGVPPAIAGVVIGIVLGLIVSAIVFRFAMAAAGASMATLASLGCAAMWLSQTPDALPAWPEHTEATVTNLENGAVITPQTGEMSVQVRRLDEAPATVEPGPAEPKLVLPEPVIIAAAKMQQSAQRVADDAKLWWSAAPGQTRTTMFWAGTFGGLVGLLVGLVSPKKSAAVLTAFAGSAIALLAGSALAKEAHWTPEFAANWSTLHWAGVWAVCAAAGAMIQTSRSRPQARQRLQPAQA